MLSLLNCNIEFSASGIYQRLLFSTAALAIYLLSQSNLAWFSYPSVFLLSLVLYFISKNPKPYPNLKRLSFNGQDWSLVDKAENQTLYQEKRMLIDLGLFSLIEFRAANYKKRLVIFSDQLQPEEYRLLYLAEKITKAVE